MSTPDNVRLAITLVDDLGKSTMHGPLPQLTVHALWEAAATLASALRAPQVTCMGTVGPTDAILPRELHLAWTGSEWVDTRCGCRYHPDDDSGSHRGAPHVHLCQSHQAARSATQEQSYSQEVVDAAMRGMSTQVEREIATAADAARLPYFAEHIRSGAYRTAIDANTAKTNESDAVGEQTANAAIDGVAEDLPRIARPSRKAAQAAVDRVIVEYFHLDYTLIEDGDDSWAFFLIEDDTTSYVGVDLRVEWYGTRVEVDVERFDCHACGFTFEDRETHCKNCKSDLAAQRSDVASGGEQTNTRPSAPGNSGTVDPSVTTDDSATGSTASSPEAAEDLPTRILAALRSADDYTRIATPEEQALPEWKAVRAALRAAIDAWNAPSSLVPSGELPPRWTACMGGRAMLVGHFTVDQAWQIHGLCLDTDDPDALQRDAPVQPMSPEEEIRAWRQWAAKNCKTVEQYEAERAEADRDEASEQRWEIWKDTGGLTFCAAAAKNKGRAVKPGAELFASFVATSSAAILIWDALRTEQLATEATCLTAP